MLELGPIKNKDEIKLFYSKTGLEANEFSGCVKCADKDEILGFCLYDLTPEKMVIRHIEPLGDLSLADGILRSTLHVSAEKSIMDAFYADTVPEDFFRKLGFIKNAEEKRLDIDKLFKSCHNCG